jgi:hypothetical protein
MTDRPNAPQPSRADLEASLRDFLLDAELRQLTPPTGDTTVKRIPARR